MVSEPSSAVSQVTIPRVPPWWLMSSFTLMREPAPAAPGAAQRSSIGVFIATWSIVLVTLSGAMPRPSREKAGTGAAPAASRWIASPSAKAGYASVTSPGTW